MKYQSAVLYEGSGQAQAVPLEAMEMRRRIVWLDEEITPEVANGVVRKISHLAAESDRPIVLAIDSPGGSVDAGLIICDAVSGCGAPVTTACVGRAYSMAAVVLSSGSRRLMTSSSKAMVHQPLIRQMPGGSSDDVEVLSGELREAKARLNSILKKNTGRSLREVERATRLNNNVVVVGATGSGKTTAYTEANLLSFSECNVVVSMSKRVLADRYAEEYERRGYEVAVVDLAEPSASPWGYDPLAMVRNAEDVSDLAREVVQANAEHEQDPYWSNSAAVLLEALLLASLEMRRLDDSLPPASICDAIALFEELSFRDGRGGVSESTLDHLFEALEREVPSSEAAAKWRSVKGLAYKTVSCVYSTLSVALSKMFTRSVKDVCASERLFDPSSLGVKKTALFVITSPVNLAAHSFCQLMYGGIFKSLFELAEASPGYAVPVPVHVICDDFAVGAKIASFPGTISVMRAAGVSVSLLIQSRRQLVAMYGEAGASIIWDNCDTAVYIGSTNSDDTAREVASRLDVPTSRVLTMPADEVVVIQRGRRPVVCRVFPTLTDERRVRILQGGVPHKNNFAHRQENLSAEGRL